MKQAAAVLLALGILTTIAPSASASPLIYIDTNHFVGTGVLHAPGTLANGLNVYLGAVQISGDLGTFGATASTCSTTTLPVGMR